MTPINHPGFGRPERAREGVRGRDGRGKVREGRETWRGTEREREGEGGDGEAEGGGGREREREGVRGREREEER